MLGPERIGSSAGLVTAMTVSPSCLLQIDEIGKLLATIKQGGAKSPHLFQHRVGAHATLFERGLHVGW